MNSKGPLGRIAKPRDLICAGMFAAGAAFMWVGSNGLPMGSLRNIGPGYTPKIVAVAMGLLALLMAAGSLRGEKGGHLPFSLRALQAVLLPIAAFVFLAQPLGVLLTVILSTGLAQIGQWRARPVETALVSTATGLLCSLLFVVALGLPLPIFPGG